MPHPKPNTVPTSDRTDVGKAEEERYTKQFLDGLSDFAFEWDEELIDPYALFYSENKEAGYAFHMLRRIFQKIDAFIGIENVTQSPWAYFSSLKSLLSFSKAIEALTEAAQGVSEPPVIEKIRMADRTRIRRAMLKRIIDLEPSRRTFDAEVLEYLTDRNTIFDNFLKAVYKKRAKKQDPPVTSLRQRKPKNVTSAVKSRGGTETIEARGLGQMKPKNVTSAVKSRGETETIEARERIPNSRQLVYFRETVGRLFTMLKSPFQESNRRCVRDFTGRTSTVLTLSVICLMATTGLACRALFLSLYDPIQSKTIDSDFFTLLQQSILLFFSQYALIVPYLRGMRLNTERFWFLATLIASTLTGVASIFAYFWTLPVSTFLGFVANAAQIIATLLLIQEATFHRPATPVSKAES